MSNGITGNMQAALFHCGRIKRTDLRLGMAWNYVLSAGGFIPGIGTGVPVLGILYQMAQDLGIGEKYIIKKLEQGTASERDKIYLLDKINRVAQIRISQKNT